METGASEHVVELKTPDPVLEKVIVPVGVIAVPPTVESVTVAVQVVTVPLLIGLGVQFTVVVVALFVAVIPKGSELSECVVSPG